VQISTNASDNVAVSQVSIYVDSVQVAICTSSCSYNWNAKKAKPGTHTITARAWDRAGNVAVTSISVTR
jgi:hypothetical protein